MNREGQVPYDLVGDKPGPREFVRKAGVAVMEGGGINIKGGMTVSKHASPISECNGGHVAEEG
jgi:hypothetical protein